LFGVLLLLGCAHVQAAETYVPYQAHTLVGPGIPGSPPPDVPILPDASFRYPPIFNACGGLNVREVPLTDGGTSFRFDVPSSKEAAIVSCLKQKLPSLEALFRS